MTTRIFSFGSLLLLFLTLFSRQPAYATTYTVTNTGDSGGGSLRQAILDANANSGADIISFNIPGGGVHTIAPSSPLPTITEAVTVDGYTQPGASRNTLAQGDNAVLLIELSGASAGAASGLTITTPAGGVVISGLVINGFSGDGIYFAGGHGGHTVTGNFIGTNPSGTAAGPGNGQAGILDNDFNGSPVTTIGGTLPADRNVISGTLQVYGGIGLYTNSYHVIQGNYIGTNAAGNAAIGNNPAGIFIRFSLGNAIGGSAQGAGNVISGNVGNGILIDNGILGQTTQGVVIEGNLIGTDGGGISAIPNTGDGIYIKGLGVNILSNTIGGETQGSGNIISGNGGSGVFIQSGELFSTAGSASGNVIEGNSIGINAVGQALPNAQNGVLIQSDIATSPASANTIGGDGLASNTIAYNAGNGVAVNGAAATGNSILGNSIFSNTLLGIDLGSDGVTPNDTGDGDTGPNNLQNFPVLTSVQTECGYTNIRGTLNSAASTSFTIRLFSNTSCDPSGNGEGETYLGETTVTTDVSGNGSFSIIFPAGPGGSVVTATATDPSGNTSEFSACVSETAGIQFDVNSTLDETDANPGDNICAAAGGACTLRAAVQEANAQAGFSCITVPAGIYGLYLAGSDDNAAGGDLDLTGNMAIIGAGPHSTYIFGPSGDRVFQIDPPESGTAAALSGLLIQGVTPTGLVASGGAVWNGGNLLVENSTIAGSKATFGGGIYNERNVVMNDSTLQSNTADYGGGIYTKFGVFRLYRSTLWANVATVAGGGVDSFVSGSLDIVNSTISGNIAYNSSSPSTPLYGGGINAEAGSVTIMNSTIASNFGLGGGAGLRVVSATGTITNTIFGANTGGNCSGPNLTSGGHNLNRFSGCGFTATGDMQNTDPLLGALANNGGPTMTHALLPGSSAIDAGAEAGAPLTDQRGVARPQGAGVDIGAYEYLPTGPVRIAGTTPVYFPTITMAYAAANGGSVIEAQSATFTESLDFNRGIAISFAGGFNSGWTPSNAMTTVNGTVTISTDTIDIQNLVIQ